MPALKIPNLVSAEPTTRPAPPSVASLRLRPPHSPVTAAPTPVTTSAARIRLPLAPEWYGSATMPCRFSISFVTASSITAPATPTARAGPLPATGDVKVAAPPAALAPDATNRKGSSRYPSCQAGTDVSAISAPVYDATNGPSTAAPAVATLPIRGNQPVVDVTAARPAAGP